MKEYAFQDAGEWIEHSRATSPKFVHRGGRYPVVAMTHVLPRRGQLSISEPLELDNRQSLIHHPEDRHLQDVTGFWVHEPLGDGSYAIRNHRAVDNKGVMNPHSNGNFDCEIDVFLKCNRRSNGILWHGAQRSRLFAKVHDAREIAVKLGQNSCRTEFNIDVRNGASSSKAASPKVRRGVGMEARGGESIHGVGYFHHCQYGYRLFTPRGWHVTSGHFENVEIPILTVKKGNGRGGRVAFDGQHMERCGPCLADFRGVKAAKLDCTVENPGVRKGGEFFVWTPGGERLVLGKHGGEKNKIRHFFYSSY